VTSQAEPWRECQVNGGDFARRRSMDLTFRLTRAITGPRVLPTLSSPYEASTGREVPLLPGSVRHGRTQDVGRRTGQTVRMSIGEAASRLIHEFHTMVISVLGRKDDGTG